MLVVGALVVGTMMLSSCSGGSSKGSQQTAGTISGNWQFYMDSPVDSSGNTPFVGGLQGGFLLQAKGAVAGGMVYSVNLPPNPNAPNGTPCNSGSAPVTGTISGSTVTLTAVAGSQTFTLTGTLSSDGSAITNGTYTATAGTAADGVTPCGIATTGTNWHAISVPPLTGSFKGTFHSVSHSPITNLDNQEFTVTGSLTQGENIGASNATVTGTMSFIDPVSMLSDYPCLDQASLSGQISGNTVLLQIIAVNGLNVGQIGVAPSQVNINSNGAYPVTFDSTPNGYLLHSAGTGYLVNTKTCSSGAGNEDVGFICLALSGSTACQQPITISPGFLLFPPQSLGSTPTTQTLTLSNSSGSTVSGLTLGFTALAGLNSPQTSFTGLPNFSEADTKTSDPCNVPLGTTFSLTPGQSCTIAVTFDPQESCTWVPTLGSTAAASCPLPLIASLNVNSPVSADNDKVFAVSITGTGISAIAPSTPELDFGAEAVGEASLPQLLSFTNHGVNPVQILQPLATAPCTNVSISQNTHILPYPLVAGSTVAGLQVVTNLTLDAANPAFNTISYTCDWDTTNNPPNANFQISSDTCSGTLLEPQATCSLEIALVPQAAYATLSGLDYFLELNTVQCVGGAADCEIDGGRFPVELVANPPSPLRMSPAAGLDFGTMTQGKGSVSQTITLFNDPKDPNTATVNFVGRIAVTGDYSESDDCPFSLAPGASCTLTVTFKPKIVGYDPGKLTINVTPEPGNAAQTVQLRGTGQLPPPPGDRLGAAINFAK